MRRRPSAGNVETLDGDLLHDAYPTLASYLDHMQRYSTLGADIAIARGRTGLDCSAFSTACCSIRWRPSSTTTFCARDSSTAARACCCTCTTPRT